MNLQIVALGFLQFVAYAIIWGFFSHYWVATHPHTNFAAALAFVNP